MYLAVWRSDLYLQYWAKDSKRSSRRIIVLVGTGVLEVASYFKYYFEVEVLYVYALSAIVSKNSLINVARSTSQSHSLR